MLRQLYLIFLLSCLTFTLTWAEDSGKKVKGRGMNGCGIERVDFDWNSVNIQVPDLQPVVHDLLFSSIFESLQIASLFADSYEIRVTGPPVSCPRVYLSLLTTLLI